LSETGATGPTGNRYGDAAGHSCMAIAGLEQTAMTLETAARPARQHARVRQHALNFLLQNVSREDSIKSGCHCERSEAFIPQYESKVDCFVAPLLAMTARYIFAFRGACAELCVNDPPKEGVGMPVPVAPQPRAQVDKHTS